MYNTHLTLTPGVAFTSLGKLSGDDVPSTQFRATVLEDNVVRFINRRLENKLQVLQL